MVTMRRPKPKLRFHAAKAPTPPPVIVPSDLLSPHEIALSRYSALNAASHEGWFQAALEQTKSIFALSSAGAALCVTVVLGASRPPNVERWSLIWLILAAAAFALASVASVVVYKWNTRVTILAIDCFACERLDDWNEHHPDPGYKSRVDDARSNLARQQGKIGRMATASLALFCAGLTFIVLSPICRYWLEQGVQHGVSEEGSGQKSSGKESAR